MCLLLHHLQTYLTGLHVIEVLQVAITTDFTEKQQQLCLPIGKGVAFHVVAVEVIVNGKPLAQQILLATF